MKHLAFASALLLPAPAMADAPPSATAVTVYEAQVAEVAKVAADPAASPVAVRVTAQNFFDSVPKTVVVVKAEFSGWDMGRGELGQGELVSAKDLINAGNERVRDLGLEVPTPLRDAVASASTLHDGGAVRFAELAPEQMGMYRYARQRVESGVIELNHRLSEIAAVIGARFAYATVAHEAGHREAHEHGRLSDDRVVEGELEAFKVQYDWLVAVDPRGERLPYAIEALNRQIEAGRGGSLAQDCRRFLAHLAELRQTGRDDRRLRELIERLGYREGHGHHEGDGHDHAPRAGPISA
ncbi:MAG: hypothetical protein SF051_13420 [Elusimicrobiota bacterium]|nr:hypothetical protein [Elusimicrobiota bacterium]